MSEVTTTRTHRNTGRALLEDVLTCQGEIPLEVALRSLPLSDRSWYEAMSELPLAWRTTPPETAEPALTVAVDQVTSRPRIISMDAAPHGLEPALGIVADEELVAHRTHRYRSMARWHAVGIERIREWMLRLTETEISERLDRIIETLSHAGPMIVFVGADTFTNIYPSPNLTGGELKQGSPRCEFTAMTGTAWANWPPHRLRLFYTFTHILSNGPTSLLKEMNFQQVGYWELRRHLVERHNYWARQIGTPTPLVNPSAADGDVDTAELVDRYTAVRTDRLESADTLLYRRVSGRTFNKSERVLPNVAAEPRGAACYYRRIAEAAPERRSELAAATLWGLLREAAGRTESDYVMSRGVNDYGAFIGELIEGNFEKLMSWEPQAYFCYVIDRTGSADSAEIVRSISERMKYNTWHFVPDSLRVFGAVPPKTRDYFFAPRLPDIAFHENHVHAGHIRAGITYSMRFPRTVSILEKSVKGLADVRFARTGGDHYDPADLRAAEQISERIREVHQALADFRIDLPQQKPG